MWSAYLRRDDQTVSYGTECAGCCKQQQIKNSQVRSDLLWLVVFHLWRIGHPMLAFHDVSRPSLPSSLVQSPALAATQDAPLVFSVQVWVTVSTQGLCVELRPPRALEQGVGHRLKKQWVKEEEEMWNEKGEFLSLSPLWHSFGPCWGISVWGSTTAPSLACFQILSLSVSLTPAPLSHSLYVSLPLFPLSPFPLPVWTQWCESSQAALGVI